MGLIKSKNGLIKSRKGSIFKNRIILSFFLLVIAVVIAFFILPGMYQEQDKLITVVQAVEPIVKGEVISEGKIALVKVGAYGIRAGVLTAIDDVVGKTANIDILAGDNITKSKIGEGDPIFEKYAKDGKQLVSISLNSNAAGLSGHLQKGDIINLMLVKSVETEYQTTFKMEDRPELKNLEVYDVENARAESISQRQDKHNIADVNKDGIAKTITLVVTEGQAKSLVESEYNGEFHIVFVKKGGQAWQKS